MHIDGNPVPKHPNHKRFLPDLNGFPPNQTPRFECEADVKLDRGPAGLLGHPMSAVNVAHDALDVLLVGERGV